MAHLLKVQRNAAVLGLKSMHHVPTASISTVSLPLPTSFSQHNSQQHRPSDLTIRSFGAPPQPKSSEEPKTKQLKVKKKEKVPKNAEKKESESNRIYNLLVKAYDAPFKEPPPASEEEMARRYEIGRNYVIGCFKRHNVMNHDLACKMRMKRQAMKYLPREGQVGDEPLPEGVEGGESKSVYGRWRSEATKISINGPPAWRHIPMDTPPIPGFDPTPYMEQEEED